MYVKTADYYQVEEKPAGEALAWGEPGLRVKHAFPEKIKASAHARRRSSQCKLDLMVGAGWLGWTWTTPIMLQVKGSGALV